VATPAIVHCDGISYSEIPAYLLTLGYGGKSSRIFTQRNHSQTVVKNLRNENRIQKETPECEFNYRTILVNLVLCQSF